jgi:structural maintenance of chromosome 1
MAGLVDTYHDAVSEDQSLEGDASNPLTRVASSSSPATEPQAAGSTGDSNADMEGGNGPVDGKRPQQHPSKPNPPPENGLASSNSSWDAVEGWHPNKSLQVQKVVILTAELEAREEEIKNFRAREKEMKVQLNQLQKEKEKLLDQILHLEHQHAAKSSQGGSYLDDSKAATPALLVTAINTVREIGKKFTKEFMDQLKKRPERVRVAIEDNISKQVAVVLSRPTHKKFQYQAYMNHKLFIGFDNPTFFMSLDNIDEPPHEFSAVQKSEWYRQDNFQKFQKYDLRKFSVKTLVENAEHDLFLQEFCLMKFQETFDELTEHQLFGHLQHRDCILREKKHPNTPFYESFCKLAVSVWLVHRLAFAFKTPATTFVVEKGLPFDHHKMQSAGPPDDITSNSKVGLVVLPGFQVSQSIIACEVYLVEHA